MPARVDSHWVNCSMSSGRPSLARAIATAASRTSGCWALSALEQRAMVRFCSSAVINPSWPSHSTMWRQFSGPMAPVGSLAAVRLTGPADADGSADLGGLAVFMVRW